MFEELRSSSRAVIKDVVQLVYFMRGSIRYHDMMMMTPGERDVVSEFLQKRLEQEQKRTYPNY